MSNQEQVENKLTIKAFQDDFREGTIEGYVCASCGHKQIDILVFCPKCGSSKLEKKEFAKEGKVITYTIQQVAPEQFLNEVPYAWAIVELVDGSKVTGWIPFIAKSSELPINQRVRFKKSYLPGIVFEKI